MERPAPSDSELADSAGRILAGGDGEFLLGAVEPPNTAPRDDMMTAGEPVSVCQLRYRWSVWTSAEDCWLEDLFVRSSARRAGLGRGLVEAACERAVARACRRIQLDVEEDNEAALALYASCGFELTPIGSTRSLLLGRAL